MLKGGGVAATIDAEALPVAEAPAAFVTVQPRTTVPVEPGVKATPSVPWPTRRVPLAIVQAYVLPVWAGTEAA
jgi:hypothetical protein